MSQRARQIATDVVQRAEQLLSTSIRPEAFGGFVKAVNRLAKDHGGMLPAHIADAWQVCLEEHHIAGEFAGGDSEELKQAIREFLDALTLHYHDPAPKGHHEDTGDSGAIVPAEPDGLGDVEESEGDPVEPG